MINKRYCTDVVIKNEKMIRKIFDRVYGIACYGEHYDDQNNMEIPYEFELDGKISNINEEIYNLKCKMVEEYTGKDYFDIGDYRDLRDLDCLYEQLMKEFSYKMFLYGFTLNPENCKE